MTAHYPAPAGDSAARFAARMPSVRISRDEVRLKTGDETIVLLGRLIERGSIGIVPGGRYDVNRVTVTFFASDVTIDDGVLPQIRVIPKGT